MEKNKKVLKMGVDGIVLDIDNILKGRDRKNLIEFEIEKLLPNGDNLILHLKIKGFERWIKIIYKKRLGEFVEYEIPIMGIGSNLGVDGYNLYMVCPISNKWCKQLHLAGNSLHFKHRTAYEEGLRYPSQYLSKSDRKEYRIARLQKLVSDLKNEHPKTHYQGHDTKASERIEDLETKHMVKKYKRSVELCKRYYKKPIKINWEREILSEFMDQ